MNKWVPALGLTTACLLLLPGIASARELVGTTKSYLPKLAVTAKATDGSKYTGQVTVTNIQHLATGKTLYTGVYNLDVPAGKQVMVVFSKVGSTGTLTPKSVAHFALNSSSTYRTWHFTVAAPPSGAADVISLGLTKVGPKLATPGTNPLTEVDEDGDGNSDFDDDQGDNDDVSDDQSDDQDGDGLPDDVDDDDQGENQQ